MCDALTKNLATGAAPDKPQPDLRLAVIDTFPLPIAVLTRDGRIAVVNRAWHQFAEYCGGATDGAHFPGMTIGEACRQLSLPRKTGADATCGDSECLSPDFGELLGRKGTPADDGLRSRCRISLLPRPPEDGSTIVVLHEDMEAHRVVREAVQEAHERLTNILEVSKACSWEWNIDTGVVTVDERWAEILGYTLAEMGEINEQTWRDLIHPDDREARDSSLADYLTGQRPHYEAEYRMRHKQGNWVWFRDRGKLIDRAAEGRSRRLCGAHFDITAEKTAEQARRETDRLQEQIRQMNDGLEARIEERTRQLTAAVREAQAANAAKSAFLANISHEIRTPMTAILGMAELLKLDGLTARQAERLHKMNDAAQHLLSVLNAVLDLSKIEAGKLVLEETAIDVERIVGSVVEMTSDHAREKNLRLHTRCEPISSRLIGDPTRIRQALLNYTGNALKFTELGDITIGVRVQETGSDSVVLRFEVSDTGIGIPPQALQRLFHHFEQADTSTAREHSGTGLGLVIVKQIAELMSGEVGAVSRPGVGSTFWFTARLKKMMDKRSIAGVSPATPSEDAPERRRLESRILVVDDERANREVILAMLETVGLVADCAKSGVEAVELARRTPYALILMDLHMPQMDGFEATRAIRRQANYAHVPILALSGNVVTEVQADCRRNGLNDFIGKPFSMDVLLEVVTRWLRSSVSR